MVAPNKKAMTSRQCQVAALLAERLTISEIAYMLGTSEANVSKHIRAIKDKLGIESRSVLRCYVALHIREQCESYYNPGTYRKKQIRSEPWLDKPESHLWTGNTADRQTRRSNDEKSSIEVLGILIDFRNQINARYYPPGIRPALLAVVIASATCLITFATLVFLLSYWL